MATIPTQNAVPSEAPRDLKFNSGKIDEFVTSLEHEYKDRFGRCHMTIEGMRWIFDQLMERFKVDINQAIIAAGYIPMDSFQQGAEITKRNEILRDETTGEYYRWDGDLPKTVPAGSTPESAGGIGMGAWVSVGDASLRTELQRGQYRTDAISCYYVPGLVVDQTTNNRNAAYEYSGTIYIPEGVTIRCNFLPEDDVRKFNGEGKIVSRDPWGNDHLFDVSKAINGSDFTVNGVVHQALERKGDVSKSIGIIGDSITDGAWGKQAWTMNPNTGGAQRDLNSTDYDHSANGGSHSWFAHYIHCLNLIMSRWSASPSINGYNCAESGMKMIDGWAYRNFDYGFFQNSAYENKAPDALLISMGWNDINETDFNNYIDKFDALIRKAWGYGCSVGIVTVNMNDAIRSGFEGAVKRTLSSKYPGVEYFNLATYLLKRSSSDLRNLRNYYIKADGAFDTTHPQPMGQADMGNAMLWETCKDTYIPAMKPGEMLSWATADKLWDCVGLTSREHYQFTYRSAGGTQSLAKMGMVAQSITSAENVTMSTIIFCEEDDMSLFVLEPWSRNSDFTSPGRNHVVNVYSPAGKAMAEAGHESLRRIHSNQRLATGVLGEQKTLTTFVGRLRYGINYISITYDGNPNLVYVPALITGRMSSAKCGFGNIRLGKPAGYTGAYIARINALDGITSNLFDGSQFSSLPNWFSSGQNLVGSIYVNEALIDATGIVLCYNADEKSGLVIQRNGSIIRVGEMTNNSVESWVATTVDATKLFQVNFYQVAGETNGINVVVIGAGSYSGVFPKHGGVLGVQNLTSNSATFNLSYNAIDLGS